MVGKSKTKGEIKMNKKEIIIDELKPYLNISLSEKYTELSNKEVERFLKERKENKGVEND